MPPAVIVGRAASALGHARLTDGQRVSAQRVIHYVFGAGLGVAYGGVTQHGGPPRPGARALWPDWRSTPAPTARLLPALGIQRPPWRLAPAAVAWEATSHLVFGAALEAARRLARRLPVSGARRRASSWTRAGCLAWRERTSW